MTMRKEIRELKRAVSNQASTEAMRALLLRSVKLGHEKLALIRCLQAEKLGVHIGPEVLSYCQEIADRMPCEDLHKIFRRANSRSL